MNTNDNELDIKINNQTKKEKNIKKQKVAVYVRVSTKTEAQLTSMKNQPKEFKKLFNKPHIKNKYELYNIYSDWGVTGTSLNRERFQEMLSDAGLKVTPDINKNATDARFPGITFTQIEYQLEIVNNNPEFSEIWVTNSSRFARNIDINNVLNKLAQNGVFVCFLDYGLTTRNPEDMPQIIRNLADDMVFSMKLSRDISRSKQAAKEDGVLLTNRKIYGYTYHPRTRDYEGYLEINEKEAKIVRLIYNLYLNGDGETKTEYGFKRIANYLNDKGFKTRNGGEFGSSTIRNILSNEKYKGYTNPGKYTTGRVFNRFKSNYVTSDYEKYMKKDSHPPIVSEEIWNACRDKRGTKYTEDSKNKDSKVGKFKVQNKYGQLLKCNICGSNFRFDHNRGVPFYTCGKKDDKGIKACNVSNVSLKQLLEYIKYLQNGGYNNLFKIDVEKKLMTLIFDIEFYIDRFSNVDNDRIKQLKKIIDKQNMILLNLIEHDSIDDDTDFEEIIATCKNKIKNAKEELASLTNTPKDIITIIDNLFIDCYKAIDAYNNLKKEYSEEEIIEKIDKIYVDGKRPNSEEIKEFKEVYGVSPLSSEYKRKITFFIPEFKDTYKLNELIKFYHNETYSYSIPDYIDNIEEILNEDIILDKDAKLTKSRKKHKVILDYNLSTNSFNLDDGYIKNLGIIDKPDTFEQIATKLDLLKEKADKMFSIYKQTNMK